MELSFFTISDIYHNWNNRIFVDTDSDGDDVYDDQNDCLNEYGRLSNRGCPLDVDLLFDLVNTTQTNDCYDCIEFTDRIKKNNIIPVINRYGGNMTINPIALKDLGGNMNTPVKVRFYLYENEVLYSDDKGIGNRTRISQNLGGF